MIIRQMPDGMVALAIDGAPIPDNDWWGIENSDIPMPTDPMDQLVKDEEDEYGEEN